MKFLFKLQLRKTVRAFTLVETLVSIMIITTAILGPLTVATGASSYAKQTKDTMTAMYLAQEALELIHHQQDSVFLKCLEGNSSCTLSDGETVNMAAWRIFKDRLAGTPSCYGSGCSFDFIDMTKNENNYPEKYSANGPSCSVLSLNLQGVYVCDGVHGSSSKSDIYSPNFSRSVVVTALDATDSNYNNDLRANVKISFKGLNGYNKSIEVTDFFHAH